MREEGNSLGELGTAIVAETFIGLLRADPASILNEASGWTPADGADVGTIAELLSFAGVLDRACAPAGRSASPTPA